MYKSSLLWFLKKMDFVCKLFCFKVVFALQMNRDQFKFCILDRIGKTFSILKYSSRTAQYFATISSQHYTPNIKMSDFANQSFIQPVGESFSGRKNVDLLQLMVATHIK